MHRGGRVAGRARFTSYGILTTKVNKSALCTASDRNKRGISIPRIQKNRTDAGRRGVSTVDVLAFSSAIRCVTTNQPLFEKVGVIRYDPLKKNVVRPFRDLVSLTGAAKRNSSFKSGPKSVPPLKKTLTSHPASTLESHPLRCFKRSASAMPERAMPRHRHGKSDVSSKGIAEVLKAYNTSESRDRLISKLENMKSNATECIKSLSHRRNASEQTSLTRRELLMCQQEMVQLSKQLSGFSSDRRPISRAGVRSQSVIERPMTEASEAWGMGGLSGRLSARPESQPSTILAVESLAERVKEAAMKSAAPSDRKARSESLRMKLQQHAFMVDTLKSKKQAALNLPAEAERRYANA